MTSYSAEIRRLLYTNENKYWQMQAEDAFTKLAELSAPGALLEKATEATKELERLKLETEFHIEQLNG